MKTYETFAGQHIDAAIVAAIALAMEHNEEYSLSFNDVDLVVTSKSLLADVREQFDSECKRRHEEWINSPAYLAAQKQADERQVAHEAALKGALLACPVEPTWKDVDAWEKAIVVNSNPYGAAVVEYSLRWARLMEGQIAAGADLADIADECSTMADSDGITGFQYGCAVGILAATWIHGEALRRWHNLTTQIGTGGESANESGNVLNPALLTAVPA